MENVSNPVDQTIGDLIGSTNVAAKAELLKHESLEMETVDKSGINNGILSDDEVTKAKEGIDNAADNIQSEVKETTEGLKEEIPEVPDVKEEVLAPVESAHVEDIEIEAKSSKDVVEAPLVTDEKNSEAAAEISEPSAELTIEANLESAPLIDEADLKTGEIAAEPAVAAEAKEVADDENNNVEAQKDLKPTTVEEVSEIGSSLDEENIEVAAEISEPSAELTNDANQESAPIIDEADLKTGLIAGLNNTEDNEVEVPETTDKSIEKIQHETTPTVDESDLKTGEIAAEPVVSADAKEVTDEENNNVEAQEDLKPWLEWDLDTFDDARILEECQEIQDGTPPEKLKFVFQNLFPKYESALKERVSLAEAAYYEGGGEEGTFAFPYSTEDKQFESEKKRIKSIRHNRIQSQSAERNKNLAEKEAILSELRILVDAKDSNHNIKVLQAVQERWRSIGQVPSTNAKSLWANYNALVDRYYDQRRIYLELRDVDRRKNLQLKEGIVSKTQDLLQHSDVLESVKILNTYHQEYKKIGPVPHDVQEGLWQRFKAASDEIYSKRNAVMDKVKIDWESNKKVKEKIIEDLAEYLNFDSDRINDWNSKTQSILAIQKKWDASGPVSREDGRKINKKFWTSFKTFFKNKHSFFKKLEKQRYENLKYKEELVEKATLLQGSQDWDRTSDALKNLQKEWREIGPVPEKQKNEVYKRFKAACDAFFNARRESNNEKEQEFHENLAKKEALCAELEKLGAEGSSDSARLFEIQAEFNRIGFVPRKAIKSIASRFKTAVAGFIKSASDLSEDQKSDLKLRNEISSLRASGENIDRKAQDLRRKIRGLEDDIALWKNNIEFFANSKNADALREDIDRKISNAEGQLIKFKQQLKLVRSI